MFKEYEENTDLLKEKQIEKKDLDVFFHSNLSNSEKNISLESLEKKSKPMNLLEFRKIVQECVSLNKEIKEVKVVLNGVEFSVTRLYNHNEFEIMAELSFTSDHPISFNQFIKTLYDSRISDREGNEIVPHISANHTDIPIDFVMVDDGILFLQGSYLKKGEHAVLSCSHDYHPDYTVAGTVKSIKNIFNSNQEEVILINTFQCHRDGKIDLSDEEPINDIEKEIVFRRNHVFYHITKKFTDSEWKEVQRENKLFLALSKELPQFRQKSVYELVQTIKHI